MCTAEYAEVGQESVWSRLLVFQYWAEFKLHRLRTPETAKKVLRESLWSRLGVALPIGSLGDMHRLARTPAAFRGEFRTAFKTVLHRTIRGRPVSSVDRMNYASPVDFRRAEGGRKAFGRRLPNFGLGPNSSFVRSRRMQRLRRRSGRRSEVALLVASPAKCRQEASRDGQKVDGR